MYQKGMGGEEEASWLSSLIDQADNLILTIGGYDIDVIGEKHFRDWHGLTCRHKYKRFFSILIFLFISRSIPSGRFDTAPDVSLLRPRTRQASGLLEHGAYQP